MVGLVVDVMDAGEIGSCKDLSDFNKGQIDMTRRLGWSISEMTTLVRYSRSAVLSTSRQSVEEEETANQRQGVGRTRLSDARTQ